MRFLNLNFYASVALGSFELRQHGRVMLICTQSLQRVHSPEINWNLAAWWRSARPLLIFIGILTTEH
jgi:hypothetical protein